MTTDGRRPKDKAYGSGESGVDLSRRSYAHPPPTATRCTSSGPPAQGQREWDARGGGAHAGDAYRPDADVAARDRLVRTSAAGVPFMVEQVVEPADRQLAGQERRAQQDAARGAQPGASPEGHRDGGHGDARARVAGPHQRQGRPPRGAAQGQAACRALNRFGSSDRARVDPVTSSAVTVPSAATTTAVGRVHRVGLDQSP